MFLTSLETRHKQHYYCLFQDIVVIPRSSEEIIQRILAPTDKVSRPWRPHVHSVPNPCRESRVSPANRSGKRDARTHLLPSFISCLRLASSQAVASLSYLPNLDLFLAHTTTSYHLTIYTVSSFIFAPTCRPPLKPQTHLLLS